MFLRAIRQFPSIVFLLYTFHNFGGKRGSLFLIFSTFFAVLTFCMLGNFSCFCCRLLFDINFFFLQNIFPGAPLECQTFWIQTVCKSYQQTTKIVSMIRKFHNHKPQTNPWHSKEEQHNHHERHPEDKPSKATSPLFPIKMIAILKWT